MDLSRIKRIVRDRWWILVIGPVVGVAGALVFAANSNANLLPVYQGSAIVRFELLEDEEISSLEDRVDAAQDLATFAASDLLTEELRRGGPPSLIVSDPATATLQFISQARAPDEAGDKALALRQAYFDIDPVSEGSVDDQIEQVAAEAARAEAELAALQPMLTPEQLELVEQHDLIQSQIGAVTGRLVDITVSEAAATTDEELEALTAEKEALNATLVLLKEQQAALGPRPEATSTVEELMQIAALEARIALLTDDYERLTLRQQGFSTAGTPEPVSIVDMTPDPYDPIIFGVGGFVLGLLVSLLGLIAWDRIRKEVWLAEDLRIPVLGSVAARRVTGGPSGDWYDKAGSGPRKQSIQRVRSAVEAKLTRRGMTLAIAGHNLAAQNVQALVVDLAVSMASAGASVLLVDGDYGSRSAIGTYRPDEPALSKVLAFKPDSVGLSADISSAIVDARIIRPGLTLIPAGPAPESPADALAGPQFRTFLEKAAAHFDVVLVSVGDISEPATQTAMQRLRQGIVVLTPGRSTTREIESAHFDVHQRQVALIGAVFLERREGFVRDPSRAVVQPQTPQFADSELPSAVSRLSSYSLSDQVWREGEATGHHVDPREAPIPPPADLTAVAGVEESQPGPFEPAPARVSSSVSGPFMPTRETPELNPDEAHTELGRSLLEALESAEPSRAYELVAEYLVARTEDMMLLHSEESSLPSGVLEAIEERGLIPLTAISGMKTIGDWLATEIEGELTSETAGSIVSRMEQTLARGSGKAERLDEWLSRHFFQRHLARTKGNPAIWQLASRDGDLQVLLSAPLLDVDMLHSLAHKVAGQRIDDLLWLQDEAMKLKNGKSEATYRAKVEEVHEFQSTLIELIQSGYAPPTLSSAKWWEDGEDPTTYTTETARGIAPLQDAGLLPVAVLSDEEIQSALV